VLLWFGGGGDAGSGTYQSVLNPTRFHRSEMSVIGNTMNRLQVFQAVPYRAVALLIPVCVLSLHVAVMAATLPYILFLTMIGLIVAYVLPPAGKETVIPLGIALGIPWWYMALSIAMIDIEAGLFMALNFDLAFKIPFLGPMLAVLTQKTQRVIEHYRWIARLYFFAIMLFVMVPGLGTGGFRGAIAGKLLSMHTYVVLLAIVAGALVGCFIIALGSAAVISELCSNSLLPADISAIVCNR
jgi:uncharacterized membrane protein